MANLDDLAELIAHHREAAERQYLSEIEKLRHVHGPLAVTQALELASRQGERRDDAISISASRTSLPTKRGVYRRRDMRA